MIYRNKLQRALVVQGIRYLLNLSQKNKAAISKETLSLIVNGYCDIVDPADKPGKEKYSEDR